MTRASLSASAETALFEGLNARKLSPEEIAASFVMPEQFTRLIGPDHSFLVGPRGSGKTTLLRMLQGQALLAWHGPQAESLRPRIGYSSIFVPADRLWASQVEGIPSILREKLGAATFTTQILTAFVETVLYRLGEYTAAQDEIHLPARLVGSSEVALVEECATAWRLPIQGRTLFSLQGALDMRLAELSDMLEEGREGVRPFDVEPAYASLSTPSSLRLGLRSFNRYSRQPNHRWALLLDEMELAPRPIHTALTKSLRGGEQQLILKLSFSPFDRFVSTGPAVGGATENNDYRAIYLSSGQRGTRRFTNELLARMMRQVGRQPVSASRVLGPSTIDNSGHSWRLQNYGTESDQIKLITRMREEDPSFAAYLDRRGVRDVGQIRELTYDQKSSTIRKAYPLLVFRDAILHFPKGEPVRRPRKKVTECFTGADAVISALEGNPRWIKAAFSQMLSAYDEDRREIPRGTQYDVLYEAARGFESLLRLLPPDGADQRVSVLELVDRISNYFSQRTLGKFTADPPSVFTVGADVEEAILATLRAAIIAGAVVHVRSDSTPSVLSDLRGERFRIAHLLTVRDGFEIPFRLGKSISLSRILRAPVTSPQPSEDDMLFSDI